MGTGARGVRDGFDDEVRGVGRLASGVADLKNTFVLADGLNVSGVKAVTETYADLSQLVVVFGALARTDIAQFAAFGQNIREQDAQDARAW